MHFEWPEVHCCRGSSPVDIIRPPDLQVEAAVFCRCPHEHAILLVGRLFSSMTLLALGAFTIVPSHKSFWRLVQGRA